MSRPERRRFYIGDRLIIADHRLVQFGRVIDRSGNEYRTLFPEDGDLDNAHWCRDGDPMRFVLVEDSAIAAAIIAAQSERDRLLADLARLRAETMDEIENRDDRERWADSLAYAIAPQSVIGEHSSLNNPWANAIEQAEAQHAELDRLRAELNSEAEDVTQVIVERDAARAEVERRTEQWNRERAKAQAMTNLADRAIDAKRAAEAELAALKVAVEDLASDPRALRWVSSTSLRAALAAAVPTFDGVPTGPIAGTSTPTEENADDDRN